MRRGPKSSERYEFFKEELVKKKSQKFFFCIHNRHLIAIALQLVGMFLFSLKAELLHSQELKNRVKITLFSNFYRESDLRYL